MSNDPPTNSANCTTAPVPPCLFPLVETPQPTLPVTPPTESSSPTGTIVVEDTPPTTPLPDYAPTEPPSHPGANYAFGTLPEGITEDDFQDAFQRAIADLLQRASTRHEAMPMGQMTAPINSVPRPQAVRFAPAPNPNYILTYNDYHRRVRSVNDTRTLVNLTRDQFSIQPYPIVGRREVAAGWMHRDASG
ncbi:hypothetical protein BDN70DRAFT_938877 [Pholiota conissans]|uniref:Uncharacterized protein n=1 Tax=Pholiota conissans TaxID=109636 RepID=A0A9P5YMX0_9AGAR|nr:hypothetical protein BDN70DRAFT_938877 [Pholiota conissans]